MTTIQSDFLVVDDSFEKIRQYRNVGPLFRGRRVVDRLDADIAQRHKAAGQQMRDE